MKTTIERTLSDVNHDITGRLDDLEQSLPPIPAKAVAATRAGARRINDVIGSTVCRTSEGVAAVGRVVGVSARTTSGQAEAQARRAVDEVSTGAKTVAGQAEAQAKRVAGRVSTGAKTVVGQASAGARASKQAVTDEVEDGLDDATLALDPSSLSSMTKAELYERAQALDIEGRSSMSKAELVSALRTA